jgi:AcrR family transcriptional regulator
VTDHSRSPSHVKQAQGRTHVAVDVRAPGYDRRMSARGLYAKGVAKRDEILRAALDLYSRDGYDKTSVREVARAAGLSQAGLLHYFTSKEELFVEVLRRRDVRDQERYDVGRDHPLTAEGLIDTVRHNTEEPGLVRLYVAMSAESSKTDSVARRFFEQRYSAITGGIAADIRRRQARGEMSRHLDAQAVASILVAAADGLQLQWLLDPEGVDMGQSLASLWGSLVSTR